VRAGAALGAGFDILGEGDLDTERLAAGALQCPRTGCKPILRCWLPQRQGTSAFVRFEP
jgi:hypothetical protein